jgi:hypothetical protein
VSLTVNYFFEKQQDIKFVMLDGDGSTNDTIGELETTMGKLMGAPKQTFVQSLEHKGKTNRG